MGLSFYLFCPQCPEALFLSKLIDHERIEGTSEFKEVEWQFEGTVDFDLGGIPGKDVIRHCIVRFVIKHRGHPITLIDDDTLERLDDEYRLDKITTSQSFLDQPLDPEPHDADERKMVSEEFFSFMKQQFDQNT